MVRESVLARSRAWSQPQSTPLTTGVSRTKEAKKTLKIHSSATEPLDLKGGLASAANSGVPQKVASKSISGHQISIR